MNENEAVEYLEQVACNLSEHFDCVQIMVSLNEEGLTKCLKRGSGNWYARQGMAHEFINEDQSMMQAYQIADALNPRDEDD